MSEKILVTGGGGFIGRNLSEKLVELNNDVTIFDLYCPPQLLEITNIRFIKGNISNNSDINKLTSYDFNIIIHLASTASVPNAVEDPESDFFSTAYGTLKMLELAKEKKINKFIYISTVSIYDTNNKMPLHEKSFIKVSSPFGASKLCGESYCQAFNRTYGLDTNIIRLFNAYGPGMNKYFIYDIVKKFMHNPDHIQVLGDGNQVRDYLFIDDVVDAIILISKKGVFGEDYNLGSGVPVKIIDAIHKIANIMSISDYEVELTNQSWKGDISEWYADIKKIVDIGFRVKTNFDNGLEKTINHILIND